MFWDLEDDLDPTSRSMWTHQMALSCKEHTASLLIPPSTYVASKSPQYLWACSRHHANFCTHYVSMSWILRLKQAMDTDSNPLASARVIHPLGLLLFHIMAPPLCSWELQDLRLGSSGFVIRIQRERASWHNILIFWHTSELQAYRPHYHCCLNSLSMWRCNRDPCGCSNCTISSLQDQIRAQQEEILDSRNMIAQLQQQIQMQEIRRNEELVVVMREVNRNTEHIRTIHCQLINPPQQEFRLQAPAPSDESRASNAASERPRNDMPESGQEEEQCVPQATIGADGHEVDTSLHLH
jgi:hypothetical protein